MILKTPFVLFFLGALPILLFEEAMAVQRDGQETLATALQILAAAPYCIAFFWVLIGIFILLVREQRDHPDL